MEDLHSEKVHPRMCHNIFLCRKLVKSSVAKSPHSTFLECIDLPRVSKIQICSGKHRGSTEAVAAAERFSWTRVPAGKTSQLSVLFTWYKQNNVKNVFWKVLSDETSFHSFGLMKLEWFSSESKSKSRGLHSLDWVVVLEPLFTFLLCGHSWSTQSYKAACNLWLDCGSRNRPAVVCIADASVTLNLM